MDYEKYIGLQFDEVKLRLEEANICYKVIEVWDTKKTQMGNDIRVINIKGNDIIEIYVAYF